MKREKLLELAEKANLVRFEGGENEAYRYKKPDAYDHTFSIWSVCTEEKLNNFVKMLKNEPD